jgi:hypothetical protein
MLNWFQHLVKSMSYETLNQVQGDNRGLFQQPVNTIIDELLNFNFLFDNHPSNHLMKKKGFERFEEIIWRPTG